MLGACSWSGTVVQRVIWESRAWQTAWPGPGCFFLPFLLAHRELILQLNEKLLLWLGKDLVANTGRGGTIPLESACLGKGSRL